MNDQEVHDFGISTDWLCPEIQHVLYDADDVLRHGPRRLQRPPHVTRHRPTPEELALYRWNSDLAAAFFAPLGHLEIMLRNALDAQPVAGQQRRGRTEDWYSGRRVPVGDKARADIAQAQQRAGWRGAASPRGKVIAELSFGLWRFLLARQYKTKLWPDLAGTFPHAPDRALSTGEDPVSRLHKFRNRIAHHEGIWHLPTEDPRDDIQTARLHDPGRRDPGRQRPPHRRRPHPPALRSRRPRSPEQENAPAVPQVAPGREPLPGNLQPCTLNRGTESRIRGEAAAKAELSQSAGLVRQRSAGRG
ncbi:hypothetical protein ACH4A3_20000 [Streptomyces sp. NPDC018007]|uniref:hypothetical protein n=1 Tax=Streptomyces sp. NPDC018007 TaxID=3365029 RepID=UPI0037B7E3F0